MNRLKNPMSVDGLLLLATIVPIFNLSFFVLIQLFGADNCAFNFEYIVSKMSIGLILVSNHEST